ncbi:MAG: ABC transporter permease [Ruminococcaceae bacterium]|nr:ABC transporter permease [Oscillospiraceae bacterium]
MNNIVKIFCGTLRRLKIAIILALICGIAGVALYFPGRGTADAFMADEKIDVAVIDNDNSELSKCLKTYFDKKVNMNIVEEATVKKYNDMLINTDISAIIEIPEDFQQSVIDGNIKKITSTTLDDYENAAYVSVYIDGFMRSADVASAAAKGDKDMLIKILSTETGAELTTESAVISSREAVYVQSGYYFSSGFLTMLVYGVGIFVTLAVMDDKTYGTYNRMRASSVTGMQYIIGTSMASSISSLLVMLPVLLFLIISGAEITFSIPYVLIANILFALISTALAIFIALLVNEKATIFMLSGCIAGLGSILGGAFFPIMESAGPLKYISMLTPQFWFTDLVGGSSANPLINITVLALYTALLFLASAVIFSKRAK